MSGQQAIAVLEPVASPRPAALAYLQALVARHTRRYELMLHTLDPDIPLGDNKECDSDTGYELLPADRNDRALSRALAFATARIAGGRKSP